MKRSRIERVAQLIKEEISQIIHDELKDPRIGFITITRVELSADCQHTKVYFSVLGSETDSQKAFNALQNATGFIRKLIGDRVKLRYTPEIVFKLDKGIGYSTHISEMLDRLKKSPDLRSDSAPRNSKNGQS